MPQLRFNEDGEWHDFAPEGWTGLKAGLWFPYLWLWPGVCLSDHRVNRPKPLKECWKNQQGPVCCCCCDSSSGRTVYVV